MSMDGVYEEKQWRLIGKSHRLLIKKSLQLVVSVALLSILVCHSNSTYYDYSLFPHSFNVYLSTFLFSFFTHTLERKYMFLLCNGILAFLAKTSLSNSSSLSPPDFGCQISTPIPMEANSASFTDEGPALVTEGEVVDEYFGMEEEEEEDESEVSVIVEDEEQQLGGDQSGSNLVISQQQQEEEEDGIANEEVSSTDELNRKVEEFIRKMKEEIRIEAQQQLITAL
ncbi:hypothetical protein CCACVL1_15269 [Corchorus capsularis]|uniref:Uncharacterized protein n=1 Tax=Corchorus capsularis TaxID=210143 RepID=A0A1R3I310_COCAP|nr:hypothetical protein CCACVL1_15269 [Corchorus capsularis]